MLHCSAALERRAKREDEILGGLETWWHDELHHADDLQVLLPIVPINFQSVKLADSTQVVVSQLVQMISIMSEFTMASGHRSALSTRPNFPSQTFMKFLVGRPHCGRAWDS